MKHLITIDAWTETYGLLMQILSSLFVPHYGVSTREFWTLSDQVIFVIKSCPEGEVGLKCRLK